MFVREKSLLLPSASEALPGRSQPMQLDPRHFVNDHSMKPPYPAGFELAMFGLGCFWGAERRFWETDGVYVTAVGYAGGITPNPTYEEVCTGLTGHNEVVRVVYDPAVLRYEQLLKLFWEAHDPTQGMRQGNDVGTQYRSGIYTYRPEQQATALETSQAYQTALQAVGLQATITTEILTAPDFYFAEEYHQQYLAKNPNGYCGLGGIGVPYP